jgi:hypothetical protein
MACKPNSICDEGYQKLGENHPSMSSSSILAIAAENPILAEL